MSTLNICTSGDRPESPSQGDMLYETNTQQTIVYDGSGWQEYPSITAPYDLDGTNSMSCRPQFHFDAGKINGEGTGGNPSHGDSLTTSWKSVYSKTPTEEFLSQGTASLQPTWNSGHDDVNGRFNSQPHVYFDGADEIILKDRFTAWGGYTVFVVGCAETTTSNFGGFVPFNIADATESSNFDCGASGPWAGRYYDTMQFYGNPQAGYNSAANGGKPAWVSNMSVIEMIHLEQEPIGSANGGGLLHFNGNNPCSTRTNEARIYPCNYATFGGGNYDCKGYIYEMALFPNTYNSRSGENPLSTADKNAWNAYVRNKYGIGTGAGGDGIADF